MRVTAPGTPKDYGERHVSNATNLGGRMRFAMLVALLALAGCARNRVDDEENTRVRDSTLTARDTLAPDDTLDRGRRAMPDTAGGLDTTSRR
jgi:hypothetical protein